MAALGTILVIEDDQPTLELIADALSYEGYTVHAVSDAVGGITALTNKQPDLILTDYRLPQTNGLTLARSIRNVGIDVPIVLITADNSIPQHPDIANVQFCILKPFQLDELLECVARYIGT